LVSVAEGCDAPKIPSGKGKRLIVLHAGTRSEGLIDGCDLVFLAKLKDGDYNQEMNSVVFLEWFENQLMTLIFHPVYLVWCIVVMYQSYLYMLSWCSDLVNKLISISISIILFWYQ
jgi:hypothetical protein